MELANWLMDQIPEYSDLVWEFIDETDPDARDDWDDILDDFEAWVEEIYG